MVHILSILAPGIGQTLAITAAAFLVGAVAGFLLALMRRSHAWLLQAPAVIVVEVVRATPPIVWLFVVYYGIGKGVLQMTTFQAATVGLGAYAAVHLSEIYRSGLDSVPAGQWDAARALSLPRVAAYTKVLLPQAFVVVIPPMATFAIGLLKDSAIASVIGATDITYYAVQQTQVDLNGLGNFAVAGLLYVVLSVPVAALARTTDHLLTRRLAVA